jgi:hypothetical protein
MADWLEEIEDKKKREQKERDEARERMRPGLEAAVARAAANYERNKEAMNRTFDSVISYAERANQLAGAELISRREDTQCRIKKNNRDRWIKIYLNEGDTFGLSTTDPIPWKKGDPPGAPTLSNRYSFTIPINHVGKEHIAEWVKWVATGEGSPAYWRDIRGGRVESTNKPEGYLYNVWTYIIILGVILFFIYLSSQR